MVTFGQEMQSAEITGDTDMSQSGSRSDDEIEIAAVIFDMDGVLTDTAHAHFSAWKETFDTFLKDCGVDEPFTRNDYLKNVDGVPRYDGVRGFLASRDIQLPEGDPDDESMETIFGLGNHKNTRFRNWLSKNQLPVFDDAADLLEGLGQPKRAAGAGKRRAFTHVRRYRGRRRRARGWPFTQAPSRPAR